MEGLVQRCGSRASTSRRCCTSTIQTHHGVHAARFPVSTCSTSYRQDSGAACCSPHTLHAQRSDTAISNSRQRPRHARAVRVLSAFRDDADVEDEGEDEGSEQDVEDETSTSVATAEAAAAAELAQEQQQVAALQQWREKWNLEQMADDNTFAIESPLNQRPDVVNDPEWHTKVTDWYDFWNNQKWDYEVEGIDDEVDVGGTPLSSKQRLLALIQSIKDNKSRSDVMQYITTQEDDLGHFSTWELPPVAPERNPLNPLYSQCDLRAIAEKKARKALMDAEWRQRQQALVGRLRYPDPYASDPRFEHFGKQFTDMNWSEKRIMNLITIGGTAARPEDHGGMVENPLVPIDYVQTMGVFHVDDTEEFIESIGHLATPEDESRFAEDEEVVLEAMDALGLTEADLYDEDETGDAGEEEEEDREQQEPRQR